MSLELRAQRCCKAITLRRRYALYVVRRPECREMSAQFGRSCADDSAVVAGNAHAVNGRLPPCIELRPEAALQIVPREFTAQRQRKIRIGHYAVMQQHQIGTH